MSRMLPLSVVVLVHQSCNVTLLKKTLTSLQWVSSEVFVADSLGITLPHLANPIQLTHLPLLGDSLAQLQYQGALRASQPWVLFLHSGETLPRETQETLRAILDAPYPAGAFFAFQRNVHWQTLTWQGTPLPGSVDLIDRVRYLEQVKTRTPPVVIECHAAKTLQIAADNLFSWILSDAQVLAYWDIHTLGPKTALKQCGWHCLQSTLGQLVKQLLGNLLKRTPIQQTVGSLLLAVRPLFHWLVLLAETTQVPNQANPS